MIIVIIVSVLVLVAGIVLSFFAPCMDNNVVAMIGGLLSASATVFLGIVAFSQNRKYRDLSIEANERTERLMFTPEFHVQMIRNQSYASEMPEIIVAPNHSGPNFQTSVVCVALNLPLVNIQIKQIGFVTDNTTCVFEKQNILLMAGKTSIVIPNTSFSIGVSFPRELFKGKCECHLLITYENIYQSCFEKELVLQRKDGTDEIILKAIEKAQLLEKKNSIKA